jgi:tetratricopeptide (TPR) repeat protein
MRSATVLAAALVCVAAEARAQPADTESLVKQGLELRREHRDAEALDVFRRAYASGPTPRILAQVAFAEQALGRWVDAEADLQKALASGDDAWIARNLAVLERGRATIAEHLGWLEVAADVSPAQLAINGVDMGVQPMPARVRVEAGSLVIEVRAPGYVTVRRPTSVDAGGTAHESIHLVQLVPPPQEPAASAPPEPPPVVAAIEPAAPASRKSADPTMRNAGLVSLGAAVVALDVGSYFGIATLLSKWQRDRECSGATCDAKGVALDQQARSQAIASTAWVASGLLAAGIGVTLVLVSRSGGPATDHAALQVGPALGADRAGAQLGGTW